MNARELDRMVTSSDPGLRAWAKKEKERREEHRARARKVRLARSLPRRREEAETEAQRAARQAEARAAAMARAGGQCEYDEAPGQRCRSVGTDGDHAVGGAYREDCDALGAEGLIWTCRVHHDLKTANSPSRRLWLDQAKRHALEHGLRRLLAIVERAIARDDARHQRRASR